MKLQKPKKDLVFTYKLVTEIESPIQAVMEEMRGIGDAKILSVLVATVSGRQVLEFQIQYTEDAFDTERSGMEEEVNAIGDVISFEAIDVTMKDRKGAS